MKRKSEDRCRRSLFVANRESRQSSRVPFEARRKVEEARRRHSTHKRTSVSKPERKWIRRSLYGHDLSALGSEKSEARATMIKLVESAGGLVNSWTRWRTIIGPIIEQVRAQVAGRQARRAGEQVTIPLGVSRRANARVLWTHACQTHGCQ